MSESVESKREEVVRSDKAAVESIPHGSLSGYVYHKCSCVECRAAQAAYHRERRQSEREELKRLRAQARIAKRAAAES